MIRNGSYHIPKVNQMSNTKIESTDTTEVSLHVTMKGMNKSQKIRYLDSIGYPRTEISKIIFVRYQFVRNVLNQPLKTK